MDSLRSSSCRQTRLAPIQYCLGQKPFTKPKITVAVGTLVAQSPPHRSVRADFPHTALILDTWRQSCLTHACQTLGHPFPVLCRTGVGRAGVLLDPRSSLLALRLGLRLVVRATLRYYTSVRLLRRVHAGGTALRLFPPVCRRFRRRRPGGLPVPMHRVSKRARALRLRGAVRRLAFIAAVHVAFAVCYQLGAPELFFRSSITRPTYAPVYASMAASRRATQDSGSGWVATPFL